MVTLDNFGLFLSAHLGSPTSARTVPLTDKSGLVKTVRVIGTSTNGVWNETALGGASEFIQVGKGTTPATRQDFAIESPFVASPENVRSVTLPAGYNSGLGKVTVSATIGATGGSGSVTEVTKEVRIVQVTNNLADDFIWFHDIISPVAFILGQQINVSYEVLI